MTLRVVAWSTGTVGRHAIAGIDARPELELVGVWVSNPDKVGKDAGELAGLGRDLGVVATDDRDALLALKPDCIVHTAMTDDRMFEAMDDLMSFLEHGVNVVSSGPVVLQYPHGILPADMVSRIHDAGVRGGASLHVNGIDPGFANDVLPLALTSVCQRIDEVRCYEIADYSTYYQPVVMRDIFGFGQPMEEVPMLFQPGILSMAWGSVVRQIAAALDVTLDEPLVENVERVPADRDDRDRVGGDRQGHARCRPVRGGRPGRRCAAGGARARHPYLAGADARVAAAVRRRGLLPHQGHGRAEHGARSRAPR